MNSTTFIVTSPYGLHTRPSAYICLVGNLFFKEWEIVAIYPKQGLEVDAKSIIGLMTLAVEEGDEIEFFSLMPDDDWRYYVAALKLLFYTLTEKANVFRDKAYGPLEKVLKQSQELDRTINALLRRLEENRLVYEGKDIVTAILQAEKKEMELALKRDVLDTVANKIIIHGNVYGPVQVDNVNSKATSLIVDDINNQLAKIESLLDGAQINPVDREEAQFVIKRLHELSKVEKSEAVVSRITKHLTTLKNFLMSGSGLFLAAKPYFDKLCSLFAK